MKFSSTRGGDNGLALSEALARGLAGDGGLYVPDLIPRLSLDDFAGRDTLPGIAEVLLAPYFRGDALAPALPQIVRAAFDFPAPLAPLDTRSAILELFHGPTAAFKDFGARFLAQCLARIEGPALRTILVATSGDTGGAVAAAFAGRPGFRVVVLYPRGLVSARQEQQLTCWGGNIQALSVAGRFDDCQALVKRALNDVELVRAHNLTSANSISLGRLLPQMSYYAAASLEWWRERGERPGFLIPTGNLGNALACLMVRAMGLPVGRVEFCLNANRVLAEFLDTGAYAPQPSIATLANAMDVGAPSNLERLRWLYPRHAELVDAVGAVSVDDDAIRAALLETRRRYGQIVCPHTATALHELMRRRDAGEREPWIAVATAHPAKFETIVEPLLGERVAVPDALAQLLAKPSVKREIPATYEALVEAL